MNITRETMHQSAPILGLLLIIFSLSSLHAENWPQFRGANSQGVSTETNLPTKWSETENIRWKVQPGRGASSPVVWGEKLFLTSYSGYGLSKETPEKPEDLTRHLICYHRDTGELLWKKDVPNRGEVRGANDTVRAHGYASHTPVTDGEAIYCWFATHGAVAFDLDGNQLWQSETFPKRNNIFGSGASPVLFENLLLVNADLEGGLFVAFDKKTGREVWRREGIASYTTPVLARPANGPELILNRKNSLAGFNPRTGEDLWFCSHERNGYIIPTPIVQGEMVYAYNGTGEKLMAVKAGGRGDVTETKLWNHLVTSNVPSPVFSDGHVYMPNNDILHCVRASDGELIYRERLPQIRNPYPSLLAADGKIYITGRHGYTSVVKSGPNFEVLATNYISDEPVGASIAVSDGKLFLRTWDWLYCIGN